MTNLSQRQPDDVLDTTGKVCPYPLIETRKRLKSLSSGQLLEVLTDSRRSAQETLPDLSQRSGYPYEVIEDGNAWRVRIQKAD